MSSELTKPPTRSPVAPPATAVPCQLIGVEVVVSVPEVGFEAWTLGNATRTTLNNARTQTRVIKTPNELRPRQERSFDNGEAERVLVCAGAGILPAFRLLNALHV